MIRKMEKLPLNIVNRLPIRVKRIDYNYKYYLIEDLNNTYFHLYEASNKEYLIYYELLKSKAIQRSMFEFKTDDKIYLLFDVPYNKSEKSIVVSKLLELQNKIFKDFSFSLTLKKEHFKKMQNTYKVLDNKFTYLEFRIREIETSPIKNDISWLILSKYNIILDAKLYLYDLQQDMFKFIDNKQEIEYGLIFNSTNTDSYKNGLIEPQFNLYYGTYASLLARWYMMYENENIDEIFLEKYKKLDKLNQKYFCFLCLYIYMLNINLEMSLNEYNIFPYIQMTKKIKAFIKKYGDYMK